MRHPLLWVAHLSTLPTCRGIKGITARAGEVESDERRPAQDRRAIRASCPNPYLCEAWIFSIWASVYFLTSTARALLRAKLGTISSACFSLSAFRKPQPL